MKNRWIPLLTALCLAVVFVAPAQTTYAFSTNEGSIPPAVIEPVAAEIVSQSNEQEGSAAANATPALSLASPTEKTPAEVAPTATAVPEPTSGAVSAAPEVTATPAPTEEIAESSPGEVILAPTAVPVPALRLAVSSNVRYVYAMEGMVNLSAKVTGGMPNYTIKAEITRDGVFVEKMQVTAGADGCAYFCIPPQQGGDYAICVEVWDEQDRYAVSRITIPVAVHAQESKAKWERSAKVELTGDWRKDLVAVAQTQVGYLESSRDFIVDEQGVRHGYTRYGDWYGAPYSEWCAMFISFCAHYANVPVTALPKRAHTGKLQDAMKKTDAYRLAEEEYLPQNGDLVFFSWEDDDEAEHVGIVESVEDNVLYSIQGNVSNGVYRRECSLNDESIVGYVSMTALMEQEGVLRKDAQEIAMMLPEGAWGVGYTLVGDVNVRKKPSTKSDRVTRIDKQNADVMILAKEMNGDTLWYQVQVNGRKGYIRGDLLDALPLEEILAKDMVVISQPTPIQWMPDQMEMTLDFQVEHADAYRWERYVEDAWQPIGEGNLLTVAPSLTSLQASYRCVAEDARGNVLTSETVTLLADPYLEWMKTCPVTEEMLVRALNAGGLDVLVLEHNTLIHTRTGQAVARLDNEIGCFVDCATGLAVARLNTETGELEPVVTENDILD